MMEGGEEGSSRSASGENQATIQTDPIEHKPAMKRNSDPLLGTDQRNASDEALNSSSSGQMRQPGKIIKDAILSKKGRAQIFRPWALRRVRIDDQNNLFYYDRNELKGVVSLSGTGIRHLPPEQADGRNFAFEIFNINSEKGSARKKSLILAAGSQHEAEDWVESLSAVVKSLDKVQSMEYQSLEDLARMNINKPIDLKKLKEKKKKQAMGEQEDGDEDEEGEEGEGKEEQEEVPL